MQTAHLSPHPKQTSHAAPAGGRDGSAAANAVAERWMPPVMRR
jgi:hypothetical protein